MGLFSEPICKPIHLKVYLYPEPIRAYPVFLAPDVSGLLKLAGSPVKSAFTFRLPLGAILGGHNGPHGGMDPQVPQAGKHNKKAEPAPAEGAQIARSSELECCEADFFEIAPGGESFGMIFCLW